jgi:hypothetical protein
MSAQDGFHSKNVLVEHCTIGQLCKAILNHTRTMRKKDALKEQPNI